MRIKYIIEPEEPVFNENEFVNEVINWSIKENHELDIKNISKYLIRANVDGKLFMIKLESPKTGLTHSDWGLLGASRGMLGYKCIYFYEE